MGTNASDTTTSPENWRAWIREEAARITDDWYSKKQKWGSPPKAELTTAIREAMFRAWAIGSAPQRDFTIPADPSQYTVLPRGPVPTQE